MRDFVCPKCGQQLTFENSLCLGCGSNLGFDLARGFAVLTADGVSADDPTRCRCANLNLAACNWLTPADSLAGSPAGLCVSCALTRTRPADTDLDARCIRPRTGPRPSRTTCTSATPSTPPPPSASRPPGLPSRPPLVGEAGFARIIDLWLPLAWSLNMINRSMGHPDLYPFVLPPAALDKMRLVHLLVTGAPHAQA